MKRLVNPEMLILARESLGISQSDLAKNLTMDQGNLSKMENGLLAVSEEMVTKIANELHHPVDFFYEQAVPYSPHIHFFRKAKTLPSKDLQIIKANSIKDRLRIEKLLTSVDFPIHYPSLLLEEYESTEEIAKTIRELWKLPNGAIKNVTNLLESKGILIVPVDFGTRLISDITTDTESGVYIIFLNNSMPIDRKRFTLCHVLGHILMHNFSEHNSKDRDVEQEADRFAGEFLMPSNDIRQHLTNLSISKLADLKRYWKVSMQALIMRASQLNTINDVQKANLWKQISSKGYRLQEPVDISIPNEEPRLLMDILELHKKELGYTESDLIKFLYLLENDYSKYGLTIRPKLKLIHLGKTNE